MGATDTGRVQPEQRAAHRAQFSAVPHTPQAGAQQTQIWGRHSSSTVRSFCTGPCQCDARLRSVLYCRVFMPLPCHPEARHEPSAPLSPVISEQLSATVGNVYLPVQRVRASGAEPIKVCAKRQTRINMITCYILS